MMKELNMRQDALQNRMLALNAQLDQFRIQLAGVQAKLYAGGTVEDHGNKC